MVKSCWICKTSTTNTEKSYFRIPKPLFHRNCQIARISALREEKWRKALFLPSDTTGIRICSDHFVSGYPAQLLDINDPDWVPSQNLKSISSKKGIIRSKYKHMNDAIGKRVSEPLITGSDSAASIQFVKCRFCLRTVEKELCINILHSKNKTKLTKIISVILGHEVEFNQFFLKYVCQACVKKIHLCNKLLIHFRKNEKRLAKSCFVIQGNKNDKEVTLQQSKNNFIIDSNNHKQLLPSEMKMHKDCYQHVMNAYETSHNSGSNPIVNTITGDIIAVNSAVTTLASSTVTTTNTSNNNFKTEKDTEGRSEVDYKKFCNSIAHTVGQEGKKGEKKGDFTTVEDGTLVINNSLYDKEQIYSIIEDSCSYSDEIPVQDLVFVSLKKRNYKIGNNKIKGIEIKTLKCTICFQKFSDLDGLKLHKNFCKLFYCQLCKPQMSFTDKNELLNHKKKYHSQSLMCHICGNSYSQSYLLKHFKNHFEIKRKCPFCNKILKNVTILMTHVENFHSDRYSNVCDRCGGYFKNLKKHLNSCAYKAGLSDMKEPANTTGILSIR